MSSKLEVYLKIYWLRILIITILIFLGISLIWTIIVSIQSFNSMESFYRKSTLSQIAIGLYAGLFQAIIFASIYMGFHYWFMFGGGMTSMSNKEKRVTNANVKWSDVVGMEGVKKEVWEVIDLMRDR